MTQGILVLWRRWAIPFYVAGLSAAVGAATPGVETFDSDTAGFIGSTVASSVVHRDPDGNPGGYIAIRRLVDNGIIDIGAMTPRIEFNGNYAAGGIRGVAVDLRFETDNINAARIRFRPVNESGWWHPLTDSFPAGSWDTFTILFDPTWSDSDALANGWRPDQDLNPIALPSPAFATVLSEVWQPEVRISSASDYDSVIFDIDNFRLLGAAEVPEASTVGAGAGLLALALLGWRRRNR